MRKLNLSIIVGVIIALIGASLVFAYGRNVNSRIAGGKATIPVLVASSSLAAGMSAGSLPAHVHVAQIPAAYVVKGAFTSTAALTSPNAENTVLVGGIPAGGQLSAIDFAQGAAAGRVQPTKGDVALSIETPLSSGVARYLQPGQLVDMFATYSQSGGASSGGSGSGTSGADSVTARTKLFASGVKVLAVSVAQSKTDGGGNADVSADPSGQVVVLLDLTPANAEKVVNATTLGSIYLAYTTATHDTTPSGATPTTVVTSNR